MNGTDCEDASAAPCVDGQIAHTRRALRVLLALLNVLACGCDDSAGRAQSPDIEAGREALDRYDCGVCHVIPGVASAAGGVGPPLEHFGRRIYVAGRLPNTPEMVARWIIDPPAYDPDTAMPKLGVSAREASEMAAYLRTLR